MKPIAREDGQIVLMTALMLTVLIGFAGLAIDVGFWMHARTKLQADADAMALAGGQELPSVANTDVKAREWGTKNSVLNSEITSILVNGTACRTPLPTTDYVTVKLTRNRTTFVAGLLGITDANIVACATAKAETGSGYYAIFANDACPSPDALVISGSVDEVEGAVHSNCRLTISGANNRFDGDVTYTGTVNPDPPGNGNTFTDSPDQVPARPFPIDYVYTDFPCTFTATGGNDMDLSQSQWYMPDGITLKTGVYCQPSSSKKISSPKQGAKGKVTLVSKGTIDLSGSNFQLTANWNDILMWAESNSSSAMNISGSGGSWIGLMVAPNGKINFSGSSNLSVSGGLLADQVSASGSDWDLAAIDEGSGAPAIRLVQ